jgi:phosphoribosylanthranilate isomerase
MNGVQRVKICGIRRFEDAELAIELGAWAIGLIFHRASPRWIEPDEARRLVARVRELSRGRSVLVAGVFVDWGLGELQGIVESVGLDIVQLHGSEPPDYAAAVEAREVWKAFRVGPDFDPKRIDEYGDCERILLDTFRPGLEGGTGAAFDWSIARGIDPARSIILAGGLGPENVGDAIALVHPFAVDVSSSVESAPGVKDARRLQALFAALRDRRASAGSESEGREP